jgi:hypothetical protein
MRPMGEIRSKPDYWKFISDQSTTTDSFKLRVEGLAWIVIGRERPDLTRTSHPFYRA